MNAALRRACALAVLALAACTAPRPASQPAVGTGAAASSPSQLLSAVQRDADQIDQSRDAAQRAQLLAAATASAQQCLAQAANDAACPYAQAQVQGLQARERPLQAAGLLKDMLTSLAKAEALDPALDHAGPARLTAVVLLRAPPWPLGPGDVDAGAEAAQRAVKRDPAYPPNLITLAQAQAKRDGAPAARDAVAKAQQAVQAWAGGPGQTPAEAATDRAQWQRAVEQGLQDLK